VGERHYLLACLHFACLELPGPSPSIDWQALVDRAIVDGVAAIVFQRVKEVSYVPPSQMDRLKVAYYQNLSANHLRLEELRRIGRVLATQQIPLMVLKGGALALSVYTDPAMRFMGDLDVLVPPGRAEAALAILLQEGYTPDAVGGLTRQSTGADSTWVPTMSRLLGRQVMQLEFHWPDRENVLIRQAILLPVTRIWQDAMPLDVDHNLYQPSAPMMLTHLCLHAAIQHKFTQLGIRQYLDLDRMIAKHGAADSLWDSFLSLTGQLGIGHMAHTCLQITRHLFDTEVPHDVLATMRPPAWKMRYLQPERLVELALDRQPALTGPAPQLIMVDRFPMLLAALGRNIFPGRNHLATFYGVTHPLLVALVACFHPFAVVGHACRRRLELALFRLRLRFGRMRRHGDRDPSLENERTV
jgi:hypothetical protein